MTLLRRAEALIDAGKAVQAINERPKIHNDKKDIAVLERFRSLSRNDAPAIAEALVEACDILKYLAQGADKASPERARAFLAKMDSADTTAPGAAK